MSIPAQSDCVLKNGVLVKGIFKCIGEFFTNLELLKLCSDFCEMNKPKQVNYENLTVNEQHSSLTVSMLFLFINAKLFQTKSSVPILFNEKREINSNYARILQFA